MQHTVTSCNTLKNTSNDKQHTRLQECIRKKAILVFTPTSPAYPQKRPLSPPKLPFTVTLSAEEPYVSATSHVYVTRALCLYRVVPGDRNWHIETADWNLAGFFTIFRNLLAGI